MPKLIKPIRNGVRVQGMARGALVLDENVLTLQAAIRDMNIHVLSPPAGMDDASIKKLLLTNRIILTRNSKDFVDDASAYDYGIIALDKLKFIDSEPIAAKNKTAKLISKAILVHSLWSLRSGFLVVLSADGSSTFQLLNI